MDNERIERLRREKRLSEASKQERGELGRELFRQTAKDAYETWADTATEMQIRELARHRDVMDGFTTGVMASVKMGRLWRLIGDSIPEEYHSSTLATLDEIHQIYAAEWIRQARNDIEAVDGKALPSDYVTFPAIHVKPYKAE